MKLLALNRGAPVSVDAVTDALWPDGDAPAMEAWRMTAELAAAANVERWWRAADERLAALVAKAGDHADSLRALGASTFSALGR